MKFGTLKRKPEMQIILWPFFLAGYLKPKISIKILSAKIKCFFTFSVAKI
jgi:hypothetical protein